MVNAQYAVESIDRMWGKRVANETDLRSAEIEQSEAEVELSASAPYFSRSMHFQMMTF
jgi:hypothetical protein